VLALEVAPEPLDATDALALALAWALRQSSATRAQRPG
jgi:Holliday junction resolvasome RuvABC endonuclease subunit